MTTIGYAVCEYFDRLFCHYPLNREGFESSSAVAFKTMQRYVQIATSSPEDSGIMLGRQIADAAETASYLMMRPDRIDDNDETDGSSVEGSEDSGNSGDDIDSTAVNEDTTKTAALVPRNAPLFAVDADLCEFITRIVTAPPFSLYHRILADEGLTPIKWRSFLAGVVAASVRLLKLSPSTVICVFVDELNTAGCLGMVTEAFLSHCVDGVPLPRNIFFVGAINPLRGSSAPSGTMDFTKSNIGKVEEDDTSDYLAMSPYIVRQLSPSMDNIKMHYPNLDQRGERYFLFEHLQQHICIPKPINTTAAVWEWEVHRFIQDATRMITKAQELVRKYEVPRVYMSIRNLIRCSQLLSWMITFTVPTERGSDGNTYNPQNIFLPPQEGGTNNLQVMKEKMRRALIMAISVTYLFQLPSHGHMLAGKAKFDLRALFYRDITQNGSSLIQGRDVCLKEWKDVIANSLTNLFSFANIPKGLARTTALKENFYSVVLASINKMPLLITGPPGCGKTLSFLLACDALKGSCPTHSVAFQSLKKAKKITYQCSVASTGPEIAAVCSGAHLKQRHLDEQQYGRHVCLLGLDEAGLTPENRQALKSLHDFLDMREIGTVMMSNTTLDAAKTSRTIQLLQTQVTSCNVNL
jgi:hypothetical protein